MFSKEAPLHIPETTPNGFGHELGGRIDAARWPEALALAIVLLLLTWAAFGFVRSDREATQISPALDVHAPPALTPHRTPPSGHRTEIGKLFESFSPRWSFSVGRRPSPATVSS
jgi:hypothetical protein